VPRSQSSGLVVTFDVFSALTDSRSGGSDFLNSVIEVHGWPVSGPEVYERWDSTNKELHRTVESWVPFRDLSAVAMSKTLGGFGLPTEDAGPISHALFESMVDWPLWPDVSTASLSQFGARLGLLSNIDDQLLAGTAVARLGVFDPQLIVTSQKAQAYKPAAGFYNRASQLLGPFVHVASSARDVRGSTSARIPCIRLVRPGHSVDASGPLPKWTAGSMSELPPLVALATVEAG
jgi:2-haloacid dehalogenase